MKFVYYDPETKIIKMISPVKEMSEWPFIKVEDHEAEPVLTRKVKLLDARVEIENVDSEIGRIKIYQRGIRQWKSIDDWLYLIPTLITSDDEVIIVQNIKEKTVTISITEAAKNWWKENRFLDKKETVFAACLGPDPHHSLWSIKIPSEKLLDPLVIPYTGSDNLRFFTHRYFEAYRHEQLT